MAIQNRRGLKKDFDPAKMLPGEFAVSIDSETENQIVWMCFAPGVVKRIGTYEDFKKYLDENCKTAYEYAVDGGYTGTEDEFKSKMAQECADAIVASASGAVIPLSDSAERKLKGLRMHGKSTQDGTPSPSAQVEIVNAGKYNEATGKYEVEVKVTGKNIIPNDGISIVGESIYIDRYNGGLIARKGVTYTLSTNYAVAALYVRDYNDFNTIKSLNYNQKSISYTPQEDECLSFSVYNSSGIPTDMVVQLEVGATATPYEAHKEQTVTITSDRPITKWDKLEKRNGVYGWAYKGLNLTVDGSGTWEVYNGDYAGFIKYSALPENMNRRDGYCNQLRIDVMGGVMQNGLWIGLNGNNLLYMINNDYYDSSLDDKGLANWKAHLNENPLIIWTYSDTETWVPLSQTEQDELNAITTYRPNTTITTDQGTDMDVEYVADTKNYIDGLVKTLKTAIIALGGSV